MDQHDAHVPAGDYCEIDPEIGEELQPGEEEQARQIAAVIARGVCRQFVRTGAPARRDVHVRAHGCVAAEFTVELGLPVQLAQGVFVPGKTYAAWIRFSNATANVGQPDGKTDVHAMAIKLVGLAGDAPGGPTTQDFILLDSPVFAASDSAGYLRFVKRQADANPFVRLTAPLALGLRGLLIGRRMESARISNPLAVRYWSAVPYRLGNAPYKQAVKYSAIPRTVTPLAKPARTERHYLRDAMIAALDGTSVTFDFLVQPRSSDAMLVEDSRVEWKETDAPFVKVATIAIPQQHFACPERDALAENLAFNPWHGAPEHRPIGNINRTRRIVYTTVSELRRHLNGIAIQEP